jgi:N-acyl-D-aspartate/D-glutamate deacylase
MRAMVLSGLEAGAAGVSAGLDYKPAYYATTDEVVRVVDAARTWRTHFSNHERVTPESGFSSRAGIEETIAIGERSGLGPLITHMKAQGREQGTAAALIELMRAATRRGAFTSSDLYPYLAGQTSLGALIIPAWAQDGGNDAMRARFADPVLRARIITEAEEAMNARFGGAAGVYLPATDRQLVDVVEEWKVSPGEAVVRLLEESSNQSVILRFGAETDLTTLMEYPDAAVACDCGATTDTRTHPRNYGTFPRVLARYVRETNTLTWEDAIRKMTGLPASLIGVVDRGFLTEGMVADITVFDPSTVTDHATYEEPAQYSEGIRHVLVNGRFALRDGAPTGERAGRLVLRTFNTPTRPMNTGTPRRLDVAGTVKVELAGDSRSAEFLLRLDQSTDGRQTAGVFRLVDAGTGIELSMVESGLVQTAPGWAAWSGTARVARTGALRAVTVIIDRTPRDADRPGTTVLVETDDGYRLSGIVR